MAARYPSVVGETFSRLTVVSEKLLPDGESGRFRTLCECVCVCGGVKWLRRNQLTRGIVRSCGCLRVETSRALHKKHGHIKRGRASKTYAAWVHMQARCYNPKAKGYIYYGARGISVCPEWRASFETFLRDMGEAPAGLSLDRINNEGNYEPGNCRWATATQQNRNKRGVKNYPPSVTTP